jgi:hypothetical protein
MVSVHVYECNIVMMHVAPDLEVTDLPADGGWPTPSLVYLCVNNDAVKLK